MLTSEEGDSGDNLREEDRYLLVATHRYQPHEGRVKPQSAINCVAIQHAQ